MALNEAMDMLRTTIIYVMDDGKIPKLDKEEIENLAFRLGWNRYMMDPSMNVIRAYGILKATMIRQQLGLPMPEQEKGWFDMAELRATPNIKTHVV